MRLFCLSSLLLAVACNNDGPGKGQDSVSTIDTATGCGAGQEPSRWYPDADGDHHGDINAPDSSIVESCADVNGYADNNDDCDDTNEGVYPGAVEVCDDLGIDYDCDPSTHAKTRTFYADTDADTYGDDATTVEACSAPEGYADQGGDCNDADAAFHPGAEESDCNDPNDYNCDGFVDFTDVDGDGTAACADCDDNDPLRAPTFGEVCDGIDNNCDTFVDESTALDAATWYQDADKDSYGDGTTTGIRTCTGPVGYVPNGDDCDDSDPQILGPTTWHLDIDGDGYGDSSVSIDACTAPPGYAAGSGDCDNYNADVSPGITETCDGKDNNCNGQVDEGNALGSVMYYVDADGDGYGNPGASQYSCQTLAGYVTTGTDCDDTNPSANPGAPEVCGGGDEDCDGYVDEYGSVNSVSFYADIDGDTYGDPRNTLISCTQPIGYITDNTDCNDANASAHPNGVEVCDAANVDEDCNGVADDDDTNPQGTYVFYNDSDTDGYGYGAQMIRCDQPYGSVTNNGDCDDGNVAVYPGAYESCDNVDNDCDGQIDEGSIGTLWYADADGDTYGDRGVQYRACFAPAGYVSDYTDCNDNNGTIHPMAPELCNGTDDDCDGYIDDNPNNGTMWYIDKDSDGYGYAGTSYAACNQPFGYVTDNTDCNDLKSSINPGTPEVCDAYGVDENCNGLADDKDSTVSASSQQTYYLDADYDGYGPTSSATLFCTMPAGYSTNDGDCNDADGAINPAASEVCDAANTDEDCDGLIDDSDPSLSRATWNTWYRDADSDTYGTSTSAYYSCDLVAGYAATSTDCDDTDATVNPGMTEICYDGKDNDCDGKSTCGLYATYKATDAAFTFAGHRAGDAVGTSVLGFGDLNSDGYDDIATAGINADDVPSNSGTVSIFYGRAWSANTTLSTSAPDVKLTGPSGSAHMGSSMSTADMDGDGDQDLLLGAYSENSGGASAGAVYLITFPFSTAGFQVKSTTYKAMLIGENGSDFAGWAMAGVGSVNGDTYEDVLVGAYGNDQSAGSAGAAYLVRGPLSGSLDLSLANTKYMGISGSDVAGKAVSAAGDTDGDGYSDFLIGAPSNSDGGVTAGAAYLLLGKNVPSGTVSLSTADANIRGVAYDKCGSALGAAGDQDGDGYDDYYIACPGADTGVANGGSVYLLSGNNSAIKGIVTASNVDDAEIYGEAKNDGIGYSVTHGDWNGDAQDDLMLGAVNTDTYGTDSGATYVCFGAVAGVYSVVDCGARILGGNASELVGSSVSNAGDFDNDGYSDILLGAPGVGTVASGAGAAYLFRGGGI